jgi:CRISPR system Cascade subunit CasE
LLAYTRLDAAGLVQRAALADPDAAAALGLGQTHHHGGMNVRPFPANWEMGHTLWFEVRVRPIIREGKTGRERDAFLAAADKAPGSALDRGEVYVDWLRDLLARQGGAELVYAQMTRYQILGVTRKSQKSGESEKRRNRLVNGPDAILSGQLRVADSLAFAQMLAQGIGRHKAFGFGLLLLRPGRG